MLLMWCCDKFGIVHVLVFSLLSLEFSTRGRRRRGYWVPQQRDKSSRMPSGCGSRSLGSSVVAGWVTWGMYPRDTLPGCNGRQVYKSWGLGRSDDAHCIPDMVDVVGGRVPPMTRIRLLGGARPLSMFATCVIVWWVRCVRRDSESEILRLAREISLSVSQICWHEIRSWIWIWAISVRTPVLSKFE